MVSSPSKSSQHESEFNDMVLLLVGAWQYEIYEESFSCALKSHGIAVHRCIVRENFFSRIGWMAPAFAMRSSAVQTQVINACEQHKPTHLLLWRVTELGGQIIKVLRRSSPNLKVITYNNDDPFNPLAKRIFRKRYYWRNYLASLRETDLSFVYRPQNIEEAKRFGAKNVRLLKPYYIPEIHRPINRVVDDVFKCDLSFVGHYEPDGREIYIKALVDEGYSVNIWGGGGWTKKVLGRYFDKIKPGREVRGSDYVDALSGAKVCLAFLSAGNRDVYTRRCFEIPACGKLLFCQRTKELTEMFKEDEEAVFFGSVEEMLGKIRWLIGSEGVRRAISEAGRMRVTKDGHSVNGRAREFLEVIKECE